MFLLMELQVFKQLILIYRMKIKTKIGNIDPQTRLRAISYFSTGPSANHLWLDHLSTGEKLDKFLHSDVFFMTKKLS